jgi:DUF971 family protein
VQCGIERRVTYQHQRITPASMTRATLIPNIMTSTFQPRSLKGDSTGLVIEWSDGRRDSLSWKLLRDRCPCATCRVKRAEPPAPANPFQILAPEETQPVRVTAMTPVGNYAYQLDFSDGHKAGIFSLELLRALGAEETLASGAASAP